MITPISCGVFLFFCVLAVVYIASYFIIIKAEKKEKVCSDVYKRQGFDGYDPEKMNYFKTNMEYSDIHEKAQELNRVARDFFKKNAERLHFEFITPSLYQ